MTTCYMWASLNGAGLNMTSFMALTSRALQIIMIQLSEHQEQFALMSWIACI